jgi:hypothetical protein
MDKYKEILSTEIDQMSMLLLVPVLFIILWIL